MLRHTFFVNKQQIAEECNKATRNQIQRNRELAVQYNLLQTHKIKKNNLTLAISGSVSPPVSTSPILTPPVPSSEPLNTVYYCKPPESDSYLNRQRYHDPTYRSSALRYQADMEKKAEEEVVKEEEKEETNTDIQNFLILNGYVSLFSEYATTSVENKVIASKRLLEFTTQNNMDSKFVVFANNLVTLSMLDAATFANITPTPPPASTVNSFVRYHKNKIRDTNLSHLKSYLRDTNQIIVSWFDARKLLDDVTELFSGGGTGVILDFIFDVCLRIYVDKYYPEIMGSIDWTQDLPKVPESIQLFRLRSSMSYVYLDAYEMLKTAFVKV